MQNGSYFTSHFLKMSLTMHFLKSSLRCAPSSALKPLFISNTYLWSCWYYTWWPELESTYSQLSVMAPPGLELFSNGSNKQSGLEHLVRSFVVNTKDGWGWVNINIKNPFQDNKDISGESTRKNDFISLQWKSWSIWQLPVSLFPFYLTIKMNRTDKTRTNFSEKCDGAGTGRGKLLIIKL